MIKISTKVLHLLYGAKCGNCKFSAVYSSSIFDGSALGCAKTELFRHLRYRIYAKWLHDRVDFMAVNPDSICKHWEAE